MVIPLAISSIVVLRAVVGVLVAVVTDPSFVHHGGPDLKPARRRRVLVTLALTLAVVAVFIVLSAERIVSRVVTRAVLADAERLAAEYRGREEDLDDAWEELAAKYARWLRSDYFDREYWLRQAPRVLTDPEAVPAMIALGADLTARWNEDAVGEALVPWLRLLLSMPKGKEILVNLLTADYAMFPSPPERDAGLPKRWLFVFLFSNQPEDVAEELLGGDFFSNDERLVASCRGAMTGDTWLAVVRDVAHPREKVRAGAIALLCHHPEGEVFRKHARDALDDPSPLVRLAAAGTLAMRGDPSGTPWLLLGLLHRRWELRWWSGFGLVMAGDLRLAPVLRLAASIDNDAFNEDQFREMASALSKRTPPARDGGLRELVERGAGLHSVAKLLGFD